MAVAVVVIVEEEFGELSLGLRLAGGHLANFEARVGGRGCWRWVVERSLCVGLVAAGIGRAGSDGRRSYVWDLCLAAGMDLASCCLLRCRRTCLVATGWSHTL